MIVLPDGKICRNLPEQVAENLKKIQEIIHFLDGVNIQDNLVVIADLSQILTAAELEIVERPVAFIYYNAELYIKKNEAAGVAYFVNVFSIEDTGTQLNFNSNEMQVNLGTGALTYATATATSYTKSQIDSLLALKANDNEVAKLTGAAFTGAISSPSITEDMSGYSFDKPSDQANYTYSFNYAGVVKTGNKITFVIACELSVVSTDIATNTVVPFGKFSIPASVGAKLFPYTQGSYTNVLAKSIIIAANSATNLGFIKSQGIVRKESGTEVSFLVYPWEAVYEATKTYNMRFEITFLLSDNLAV